MARRNKHGDKRDTRVDLSQDKVARGRGKSAAEALGKSVVLSSGHVQSNWASGKAYSLAKSNHVQRDGWNVGTLVRWARHTK